MKTQNLTSKLNNKEITEEEKKEVLAGFVNLHPGCKIGGIINYVDGTILNLAPSEVLCHIKRLVEEGKIIQDTNKLSLTNNYFPTNFNEQDIKEFYQSLQKEKVITISHQKMHPTTSLVPYFAGFRMLGGCSR